MSINKLEATECFDKMKRFAQSSSEGVIDSFCLKGPDQPVRFLVLAGIFPRLDSKLMDYSIVVDDSIPVTRESHLRIYGKIMGLEVPPELAALTTLEDASVRAVGKDIKLWKICLQ